MLKRWTFSQMAWFIILFFAIVDAVARDYLHSIYLVLFDILWLLYDLVKLVRELEKKGGE